MHCWSNLFWYLSIRVLGCSLLSLTISIDACPSVAEEIYHCCVYRTGCGGVLRFRLKIDFIRFWFAQKTTEKNIDHFFYPECIIYVFSIAFDMRFLIECTIFVFHNRLRQQSIVEAHPIVHCEWQWPLMAKVDDLLLAAIAIDRHTDLVYCSNNVYCGCFPKSTVPGNSHLLLILIATFSLHCYVLHCYEYGKGTLCQLSAITLVPTTFIDGQRGQPIVLLSYCG